MAVNQYFNHFNRQSEQNLVNDLIVEAIQARGVDMKYIMRTRISEDYFLGEAPISDFKDSLTIEMYIESMQQFNGEGDMFAKFGIVFQDKTQLLVSQSRFKDEAGAAGYSQTRPEEGDLVYIPFSNSLFEIAKVKEDEEYYQTGINLTYRLECNLFEWSHENIQIGDDAVDKVEDIVDRTFIDGDLDHEDIDFRPPFRQDDKAVLDEAVDYVHKFNPNDPFGEFDPDAMHERGEGGSC